jgi:hypothetical protein
MNPKLVRAGMYALMALGLLFGLHEVEALVWPAASHTDQAVQPAFYAASSSAPDVTFVVGSAHDCANQGLLVNEGVFPNATKTAYIAPEAKGPWSAATVKGRTVTVHGVGLSTYHNPKTGKDSPEYKVIQSNQITVQ